MHYRTEDLKSTGNSKFLNANIVLVLTLEMVLF